jgi:hypothetical protein
MSLLNGQTYQSCQVAQRYLKVFISQRIGSGYYVHSQIFGWLLCYQVVVIIDTISP